MFRFQILVSCCIKSLLLVVTALVLLSVSCKTYTQADDSYDLVNFWAADDSYIFRTNIQIYGKELSGLFVVRKTDTGSFRTVLLNEVGMKFFDFEITENQHTIHHIFEPINKKAFINLLTGAYKMLFYIPVRNECQKLRLKNGTALCTDNEKTHYEYYIENGLPAHIYKKNFFRKSLIINPDNYSALFPQTIHIRHNTISFTQSLHFLKNR